MPNIFLQYPFPCSFKSVECDQKGISCLHLHDIISTTVGLDDFSLQCNGKKVPAENYVLPNSTVHISFSLPGGKGGFGSMLRAIGAQIEKTTNREACRDLSGRRLRDINEEQRLKNWISKKAEREAEKLRRRKERLERLKSRPKHNFVDFGFEKEISELPERVEDALSAGIEKAKKREAEINEPSTSSSSKKKRLWLDDEDNLESSESDSDSLKSNEDSDDLPIKKNEQISSSTNSEVSSNSEYSNAPDVEPIEATSESSSATHSDEQENTNASVPQMEKEQETITASNDNQESIIDTELNSKPSLEDKNNDVQKADDNAPVDLDDYHNVKELEVLGLERLKNALMLRGLKCGGSLVDRAGRLWAIKGLTPAQYPKNLLAKTKKK